jgi:signal transduction histidine kinase
MLFGAATALIIAAALLVPWQRMEQLTDQINTSTAKALCDDAIARHIEQASPRDPLWFLPSTSPTTRPSAHLILLATQNESKLAVFERRALKQFADHPETDFYSRLVTPEDGSSPRFYYVRPIRAEANCLQCHRPLPSTIAAAGSWQVPAAHPTTQGAADLIGAVAVNMQSHVDTNQLLLNRIILLAAGLLAGTLATGVFYLITTRLILQPVRVLQETAEKVSQGDLNIRSHISTGDEFETLAKTFNVMLGNLQGNEDQLRQINKSLDLKLNQLAESNVALYESNRLKSEFLANVSHELRTPLNSILGFAELLKDINDQAAETRSSRYVQNILSSGRNLLELINDLLDLAKIEAGRMEIRSEPLSLSDLFEGLVGLLKPLAEKQHVTIEHSVAADVPILLTDGPKLQQVLYNFLSNAIKFSPPQQRVVLRAQMDGPEKVRLSVTDAGPGIDPEHQQLIFEKFRQIDGSVTRQHGGTGLGLAISKELVGLLQGSIGVISEPGYGATFWVNLPLNIASGPQEVRMNLMLT